ncbi:MAG: TatD family hydrolase, partial [Clostridia bacterium]|nr:TatD family hydrolase [Clostridia bacterium]
MTPGPFRGKRCDSSHIQITAQKIAEIKEISVDELLQVTKQNAYRLFGMDQ